MYEEADIVVSFEKIVIGVMRLVRNIIKQIIKASCIMGNGTNNRRKNK